MMTHLKLIKWLKDAHAKGHSYEKLQEHLVKKGHQSLAVQEAIAQIEKVAIQKHHMENQIFMSIAIILILAGLFIIIAFFNQPVCGNTVLENGETAQTCCLDTGCGSLQECVLNENPSPEQAANINFFSRDMYVYSCVDK